MTMTPGEVHLAVAAIARAEKGDRSVALRDMRAAFGYSDSAFRDLLRKLED